MSETKSRSIWVSRNCDGRLRVNTVEWGNREGDTLQSEQGAMIELGAILGATVVSMKKGDTLEIKLFKTRKEWCHD